MSGASRLKASFLTRLEKTESTDILISYLKFPDDHSRRLLAAKLCNTTAAAEARPLHVISTGYPGEYDRDEVLMDLVESALEFAAKRGFTAAAVLQFLGLYLDILESLGTTETLAAMALRLREVADRFSSHLPPPFLLLSVQYITETVLQHYHLYRYLLTDTQPADTSVLRLSVIPPGPPPPLTTGTTLAEWQATQARKELETAHSRQKTELAGKRESVLKEAKGKLEEVYETELPRLDGSGESSEAEVADVLAALVKAHVSETHMVISQEMALHKLNVAFSMDKLEVVSPSRTHQPNPPSPKEKPRKDSRTSKTPRTPSRPK